MSRLGSKQCLSRSRPNFSSPLLLVLSACLLIACATGPPAAAPAAGAPESPAPTLLPARPVATATSPYTRTPPPTQTIAPTPTATPDPYGLYTVEYLAGREYGGGTVEVLEVMAENSWFTRYLVRYPSDGLWIYGFLNVPVAGGPAGEGPYPVIVALHGYIDPAVYSTLDYTTGYADALARAGYIVFHPNLRGYPPSEPGENLFRVGMAVDVLNLIAIIREGDIDGGLLENAVREQIGLWGHSMGGGISTRVITVSQAVRAAVLYAPMSGDEKQNWEAIKDWSGGVRGLDELAVPEEDLARISPMFYYDRITARVGIHHGRADELVPLAWSLHTCDQMESAGVEVECVYYDGMPHTFYGEGNQSFLDNIIRFFNEALKEP